MPFYAKVTFIEVSVEDHASERISKSMVEIVAKHVLQLALSRLNEKDPEIFRRYPLGAQDWQSEYRKDDIEKAIDHAANFLPIGLRSSISETEAKSITVSAEKIARENWYSISKTYDKARDLRETVPGFGNEKFEIIRTIGNSHLLGRRLNMEEENELEKSWKADWHSVGKPHISLNGTHVYLCGGLLVCLANSEDVEWLKKQNSRPDS